MASLKSLTKRPILTLLEIQTSLRSLQQIHTQLLVHALLHDPLSLNHLITTLSLHHNSPQSLLYSHHLLSHSLLSKPTLFSFNTLIRAFSKSPYPHHSLHHHNLILRYSLRPDNYTFNFLIRACAQLGMLCIGSSAHAAAMKRGFISDPHVRSGLIRMYAESGSTEASKRVLTILNPPMLS
ncbi:Pentatricopeptide repeat-containing protein [Acorus calamus]|uniref:Pentatricopeptide repeat-containing protein n=1 Tax=Acorus calamus TaxID=4465 RepID=A0AAV9C3I2_ACOCL|nr:Pentatricopeptide repeat-containing protein [Acorus calamus]